MDDLKQAVQGAVYEQKDPLLIYKFEAFEMFKKMLSEVNAEIGGFMFKGNIPIRSADEVQQAAAQRQTDMSQMKTSREDAGGAPRGPGAREPQKALEPVRVEKKVGRNEPCPCGSGKKYKNCHGKDE
jgi:preprotein translocase subunit SecA